MKLRSLVRLFAGVLVVASMSVGASAPARAAGPSLLGGGSGFAALEIDQWRANTARSPYNLSMNYVAQGSTFGRQQFKDKVFDYAASDIRYIPAEEPDLRAGRCSGRPIGQCLVYVPVSAGGLAFMYNLKDNSGNRITDLRLTRQAACKIFTGAIWMWNDPEIVKYNRKLASHNSKIGAIVRDDGAGESYVLSQYCKAVDALERTNNWGQFVSRAVAANPQVDEEFRANHPTSKWPGAPWGNDSRPTAVNAAENLANFIADPSSGPDSIGYVAAGYAKVRNFPVASVENGTHAFTQPNEDNVTRALAFATGNGDGTFTLAYNGPDALAYFPSTYSYILSQTTGFDPAKGAALTTFLCYAVGAQGQQIAPGLGYARLSQAIEKIAVQAIMRIPGAPPQASCPIGGYSDYLGIVAVGGNAGGFNPGGPNPQGNGGNDTINNANGNGASSTPATAVNAQVAAQQRAARIAAAKAAKIAAQQAADDKKAADAAAAGDKLLANTPIAAKGGSKGGARISLIWILAAGAVAAWALTFFMERRKASTS